LGRSFLSQVSGCGDGVGPLPTRISPDFFFFSFSSGFFPVPNTLSPGSSTERIVYSGSTVPCRKPRSSDFSSTLAHESSTPPLVFSSHNARVMPFLLAHHSFGLPVHPLRGTSGFHLPLPSRHPNDKQGSFLSFHRRSPHFAPPSPPPLSLRILPVILYCSQASFFPFNVSLRHFLSGFFLLFTKSFSTGFFPFLFPIGRSPPLGRSAPLFFGHQLTRFIRLGFSPSPPEFL